jgi:xanthine dehydrogenase molybdopterin-binding subunit B
VADAAYMSRVDLSAHGFYVTPNILMVRGARQC